MYNVWYLVIGFGVLSIILFILGTCLIIYENSGNNNSYLDFSFGGMIINIIGMFVLAGFLICLVVSIAKPLQAKRKYIEFIETQSMVEQVYNGDDYNQYENAGLNSKIIELNQWLASAKSDVKTYGNWSMYCTIDLDSIEYIKLINK